MRNEQRMLCVPLYKAKAVDVGKISTHTHTEGGGAIVRAQRRDVFSLIALHAIGFFII